MDFLTRFQTDEGGATAIEYGLIAGLICVAALVGFQALGTAGSNVLNQAMDAISSAIKS